MLERTRIAPIDIKIKPNAIKISDGVKNIGEITSIGLKNKKVPIHISKTNI